MPITIPTLVWDISNVRVMTGPPIEQAANSALLAATRVVGGVSGTGGAGGGAAGATVAAPAVWEEVVEVVSWRVVDVEEDVECCCCCLAAAAAVALALGIPMEVSMDATVDPTPTNGEWWIMNTVSKSSLGIIVG